MTEEVKSITCMAYLSAIQFLHVNCMVQVNTPDRKTSTVMISNQQKMVSVRGNSNLFIKLF